MHKALASLCFGLWIFFLISAIGRTRRLWVYSSSLVPPKTLKDLPVYAKMKKYFSEKRPKDPHKGWDEMLLSFAHELKAGSSLENAVANILPKTIGEPYVFLKEAEKYYQSGLSMTISLKNAAKGPYAKDVAAIVDIGVKTGADMPVLLLNLQDALKEKNAFKREADAKLLEAKLTALLLAAIPWFMVVTAESLGTGSLRTLLTHPKGKLLLQGAVFAWSLGVIIIRSLLKNAVS